MADVFFSVVVPVYNAAAWLPALFESVLNQDWERLELLLVDDGSTDESAAICEARAEQDSRVRVFHRENSGPLAARCYGVERAWGDYIVFADADDLLLPGAFAALSKAVGETGADCLFYGARRETLNGIISTKPPEALWNRVVTDRQAVVSLVFNDDLYNVLWCKCARRSCLAADLSPWYHVRRGEDLLHSTVILEQARSFAFLPDELYFYRLNRTSATRSLCLDGYRAGFALEAYQLNWLNRLGVFDKREKNRWHDHLLDELVRELKRMSRFCSDASNARAAFESVLAADFYRDFLADGYRLPGGGKRRPFNRAALLLLKTRRFDALRLFCNKIYRGKAW